MVSVSCKTLVTDSVKGPPHEYYILVHWNDSSRRFDVRLTDCCSAWTAIGCTTIGNPSAEQQWQRAREALSDTAPSNGSSYTFWTSTPTAGGLQLWWGWVEPGSVGREVMRVTPHLQQQQDAPASIREVVRHMMESYTFMKTAMRESRLAQQQLERSLAEKEQLLKDKTQKTQDREQGLFTKFAMLLNKKTERIQHLTAMLQESNQELERLKGEADRDTDDEERELEYGEAAAYGAETEDEPDDENDNEAAAMDQHQDAAPAAAAAGMSVGEGAAAAGSAGYGSAGPGGGTEPFDAAVHGDRALVAAALALGIQQPASAPADSLQLVDGASVPHKAAGTNPAVDFMNAETQPLDADVLQALEQQRQLPQQAVSVPAADCLAAQQQASGNHAQGVAGTVSNASAGSVGIGAAAPSAEVAAPAHVGGAKRRIGRR